MSEQGKSLATIEQNKDLADRIRGMVKCFDDLGAALETIEGERRAFIAGHNQLQDFHANQAALATLVKKIENAKDGRANIQAGLERLLTAAREIIEHHSAGASILAFLNSDEESVIIRCERAAEFLNSKTASA